MKHEKICIKDNSWSMKHEAWKKYALKNHEAWSMKNMHEKLIKHEGKNYA